jgi:uncharacterized protein (TIGR02996 family)
MSTPDAVAAVQAALFADPDDVAAHAALADLLIERNDPRGEFIQVQLALEDEGIPFAERKRLRHREHELLTAYQRVWLGDLAEPLMDCARPDRDDFDRGAYRFARGWLDGIRLPFEFNDELAAALAASPALRLLRQLEIDGDPSQVLSRPPPLPNLRLLRIGEPVEDDDDAQNFRGGAYVEHSLLARLAADLPRLEELHLYANGTDPTPLFALPTLTSLRVLRMYHLQERHPLEVLAENPALARLTHLLLHPHGYAHPGAAFLDLTGVRALVRSPHLRSLTHLQIRLCDMGDAGCAEIVASGILKRLKVLDLRHGRITDAGARTLAACPDLRNLERLELRRNGLTRAGVAALEATGVAVRADAQQTAAELAHHEYLYDGDFE